MHTPEYELPNILGLHEQIDIIKKAKDDEIEQVEEKIQKEQEANKYLYDLLTGTDRELVEAVIQALGVLGFKKIIDVDVEGEDKSLREDIRIEDGSPILVVDVKGISGKPSDPDSQQSHKHATIRMKEWGRTDVNSLTIINHQRNLPPLNRDNDMPYRQELLDSASQIDLGLMTTWDLWRLVRSYLHNGWKPEFVQSLFYEPCRISIIPTCYEYLGKVNQIWEKAEAFSIDIEDSKVRLGDRIGIETPIEIIECQIASLKLDDEPAEEAIPNCEIGIKTDTFPNGLRKGYKVYRVIVSS